MDVIFCFPLILCITLEDLKRKTQYCIKVTKYNEILKQLLKYVFIMPIRKQVVRKQFIHMVIEIKKETKDILAHFIPSIALYILYMKYYFK